MTDRRETSSGRMGDDYFLDQWSDDDPWGFETRWYERRKRAVTLAALPCERYDHVFEPGCAQGLLTAELAERGDRVTALELVPAVAARAAERCREHGNVDVQVGSLPGHGPPTPADLVVFSEVLYYLDEDGLDQVVSDLHRWLDTPGTVIAVHWTGPTDYPQTAEDVHERLHRVPWLEPATHLRDEQFVLDVWRRA